MSRPRYRDPNPSLLDYAARQEEQWKDGQAAIVAERQPTPNRSTNRKKPAAYNRAALFLKELSCIIRHAGGGGAYHERDGAKYVLAAIPSIGAQCGGFEGLQQHPMQFEEEVIRFRDFLVPGVFDDEIETMVRDALEDAEHRRSRFLTADQTANLIGLDAETRAKLVITQIGAVDLPKDARKDLRGVKAKERAQRNRAKEPGYTPRNECKTAWVKAKAIELNRCEKTVRRMLDRGELTYPEAPANGGVQDSFAAYFSRCGANENGTAIEQPRSMAGPARLAGPRRTRGAGGHSAQSQTKLTMTSRTVAVALPGHGYEMPRDLLTDVGHAEATDAAAARATADRVIAGWTSGWMPGEVIAAIEAKAASLGLANRSEVARSIGIERGTWSNGVRRAFGLGADKVHLIKAWLMAA